jgi:hypothetical protein
VITDLLSIELDERGYHEEENIGFCSASDALHDQPVFADSERSGQERLECEEDLLL